MGSSSSSSLLDETQTNFITEQVEAELQSFVPYYRKQLTVARFSELENNLGPRREHTLRLRHKGSPQGQVLYEEPGLVLDHNKKWKERYLVVRGGFRLETHQGLEAFVKGVPPVQVLLTSGGSVWTSLDSYVDRIQKDFPDLEGVKDEFSRVSGFSEFSGSRFLVFLRLPHRRDSAFCFKNQDQRDQFCRVLRDCIRHQNQDFLRRRSPEVVALVRAVRFYREDRGRYGPGGLLIGSDVRVLSSLVLEQLLPELWSGPKKTRNRFQFLEDVHVLLDSLVLDRFSRVQRDLLDSLRNLEPAMTSDLDLIRESRRAVRDRVRACVMEAAERLTAETVVPHLSAVLTALLEPVSDAFLQGRGITHDAMQGVCHSEDLGEANMKLIASMPRTNLESCYQTLGRISDKLAPHAEVFGFSDAAVLTLTDCACLDLQQLVENAVFTFQDVLLSPSDVENVSAHKTKQRVLQHFDYDSAIVRKNIVREALISITLPYVKEQLDRQYKMELVAMQQLLDSDSAPFVAVDNEYEDVVTETLMHHMTRALTEPANLDRFQLVPDLVQEKTGEPGPEPGPDPKEEPEPEAEVGPNPEPGPALEVEPAYGPGLEPKPEPRPGTTPDSSSEVDPKPGPVKELDPGPGPDPESGSGPHLEPCPLTDPEPGLGTDSEPGPVPGTEPGPDPDPQPYPPTDPEPGFGTDPEPEPGPGPRPDPQPESEPGPDSGSDPEPGPRPDPEPGPELPDANANASLTPACVRAIGELVVLANFPDVARLDN